MTLQLFKGLVALMVMVCIPWLLESFRNLRKTDYRHSEEHLRERVQEIYAAVTLFYNRLYTLRQSGELAPTEWPDFDARYCSDDWQARVAAVSAADEAAANDADGEGERRPFFSWNYWTCSADMAFTYVSGLEVIDKTGDRGTAALTVHCGEVATPVLLSMVYERGDWRIDDITNNWQRLPVLPYYEWKHEMEAYLSH